MRIDRNMNTKDQAYDVADATAADDIDENENVYEII